MNSKHLLILIFLSVVLLATSRTIIPTPVHDIQASMLYHHTTTQNLSAGEPPVTFMIMNISETLTDPISTFMINLVVSFTLSCFTVYYLARRMFQNQYIGISAIFLYGINHTILVLFSYGYIKQIYAMVFLPIFMIFFMDYEKNNKQLCGIAAGLWLGIIGLTHEIVFTYLLVFILVYLGFQIYSRNVRETLKRLAVVSIPALIVCGWFYIGFELSSITVAVKEGTYSLFYAVNYGYLAPILALSTIGLFRLRNNTILVSMITTGLILVSGWCAYVDRFVMVSSIPLAILGAYGLKECVDLKLTKFFLYLCLLFSSLALVTVEPTIVKFNPFLPIVSVIPVIPLKFLVGIPATVVVYNTLYNYVHRLFIGRYQDV